jgi:HSP20 family protein
MRRRPSPISPFLSSQFYPVFTNTGDDFAERASQMLDAAMDEPGLMPPINYVPALDVSEQKDEFTVTAELPGLARKDVSIDYCDGVLTIRGEKMEEVKKDETDKKFFLFERRFGSFQRSIPFPGGIAESKISAEFAEGVLTVHMPKTEDVKSKRREIAIGEK